MIRADSEHHAMYRRFVSIRAPIDSPVARSAQFRFNSEKPPPPAVSRPWGLTEPLLRMLDRPAIEQCRRKERSVDNQGRRTTRPGPTHVRLKACAQLRTPKNAPCAPPPLQVLDLRRGAGIIGTPNFGPKAQFRFVLRRGARVFGIIGS
jgi:hypothetical protein